MRMHTIGAPLVPLVVGDEVDRSAWVPHVTIVGNFVVPDDGADRVVAVFREATAGVHPLRFVVGDEAWFGPDGDVLLDRVESPDAHALHERLLSALQRDVAGLRMLLPGHTRAGYHPHRTVTAGARPIRGDVLEATTVILSELEPTGRPGLAVVIAVADLA